MPSLFLTKARTRGVKSRRNTNEEYRTDALFAAVFPLGATKDKRLRIKRMESGIFVINAISVKRIFLLS